MDPELEMELAKVELAHLGMRAAELAARAEAVGAYDLAASFRMAAVDWLADASDDELEYCLLD
jgi:hypothetical protein